MGSVFHLVSLRHVQTAVLFERYPLSYCAILRSIFYKLPELVDRWLSLIIFAYFCSIIRVRLTHMSCFVGRKIWCPALKNNIPFSANCNDRQSHERLDTDRHVQPLHQLVLDTPWPSCGHGKTSSYLRRMIRRPHQNRRVCARTGRYLAGLIDGG